MSEPSVACVLNAPAAQQPLFFESTQAPHLFYVFSTDAALAPAQQQRLSELLHAQVLQASALVAFSRRSSAGGRMPVRYRTTRVGTVSPWSSKVCDILQQTGIVRTGAATRIEPVERVVVAHAQEVEAVEFPALAREAGVAPRAQPFDPLLHSEFDSLAACAQVFAALPTQSLQWIDIAQKGVEALESINTTLGLALSEEELHWLHAHFTSLGRNPSDAEIVMFAQANSEHCRHKIFNAHYRVGDTPAQATLFEQIRSTHAQQPLGTVVAYADNAAVIAQPGNALYHHVLKAETHNHPTAVEPFAGAATGAGGEIRDEGATGRGATPVASLCVYMLSDLRLQGADAHPERDGLAEGSDCTHGHTLAPHLATPLEILLQAPLGAAAFNNEFGRPNLGGAFRVFEQRCGAQMFGFHKPVMLAAGWGLIQAAHAFKQKVVPGDLLVQLGGPGYLIGLGGGGASSRTLASANDALDFASVQRANPEMQRRAQMVIDTCVAMGASNPIKSIHDVGAGGLSNALPELVAADGLGAVVDLAAIPLGCAHLSPMQIWSNESQERYVLAIAAADAEILQDICARERCPLAVLGVAAQQNHFHLLDSARGNCAVVSWPMERLLGAIPAMRRAVRPYCNAQQMRASQQIGQHVVPGAQAAGASPELAVVQDMLQRVLAHPSVASKRYLVHIGDRTVGGRTHRDSLVGPWQVPVADCCITLNGHTTLEGAAASMGERAPIAVLDAPASGRVAVAESLLNLWAAPVADLHHVKLSCNWMANAADARQDAALRATVDATAEFCRALEVAIPVGKDSLSMQVRWPDAHGKTREVQSPVTLVATAFAPLPSVQGALTPMLEREGDTGLVWVRCDASLPMGGSIVQQILGIEQLPALQTPDVQASSLRQLLYWLDQCKQDGQLLAYHDVSDAGVWATLCEMAFAARAGLRIHLPQEGLSPAQALLALLSEAVGVVVQVPQVQLRGVLAQAAKRGLVAQHIATPCWDEAPCVRVQTAQGAQEAGHPVVLFECALQQLLARWDSVAFEVCRRRDNPALALQEHQSATGLQPLLWRSATAASSDTPRPAVVPRLGRFNRPRAAVLREQGVNSHAEMTYALTHVGFEVVDVHMSDLQAQRHSLRKFDLLAACGGFSYGDALGAGAGWAKSILFSERLAEDFRDFFARTDTLTLGVCNGCQMLSALGALMPQAREVCMPRFLPNASGRFEARLSMVQVLSSDSVFLAPLVGQMLPIVLSHGEGRVQAADARGVVGRTAQVQPALRFVMPNGAAAVEFPYNPNGSYEGWTGFSTAGGRILLCMPHPERSLRNAHMSWSASGVDLAGHTPWSDMFAAARAFF